uniref:Uncharacterized protein n=1 Tax=Glossina austeni TaxID=7395 RepID=A0A1A9UDL0_GLOAU
MENQNKPHSDCQRCFAAGAAAYDYDNDDNDNDDVNNDDVVNSKLRENPDTNLILLRIKKALVTILMFIQKYVECIGNKPNNEATSISHIMTATTTTCNNVSLTNNNKTLIGAIMTSRASDG